MAQIQNMACPKSVDTSDIHFKLIKRCETVKFSEKPSHGNLLAVSHTLGLTFLGTNDGFQILRSSSIANETYQKKFIKTQCRFVTHLVVNGDESLLAVGGSFGTDGSMAFVYPLSSMGEQNVIQESNKIKLSSTPGVSIVEMFWNPASFRLLSACLSDGSLVLVEIKSGSTMEFNSLPPNAAVRCCCWSPKGKQIVVGGEDGQLTQYKPDLSPAKKVPAPAVFDGAVSVASVIWISNFQFGALYRDRNQPNASPTFMIVNCFKNEPITFINYGDITYGSQFRFPQYYFHYLTQWNLLLVSSANSVDLAVLHLEADGRTWVQWVIGDSSRAEMPLTADQDETFPYGMGVDLSSQAPVPWMEGQIAPMPRLLLISNEGVLCLYNIINLLQGAAGICSPPVKAVADSFFDAPAAIQQPPAVTVKPLAVIPSQAVPPQFSSAPAPILTAPPPPPPEIPIPQPVTVVQKEEPPTPRQPTPVKEPEPEIDDSVYDAAIWEEVVALDDDLANFFVEIGRDQKPQLGPEEEFSFVVKNLELLAEFMKDVDDTTSGQAEEISELKLDVVELTAKMQDVRLVRDRNNSHLMSQLQRSDHLDPVLVRSLREILAQRVYVESQLKQVSDHLDRQWEDHQQACRKSALKQMAVPMMEDIFKTINILKKMLVSQKLTVERLQKEVDRGVWTKQRQSQNQSKNDSNRLSELSKLADSLLGMNIDNRKPNDLELTKLVTDAKRQNVDQNELTAEEYALILDRFEDAVVPEVSHCLNFADREAHKKEVAARIKRATGRMQIREKERLAAIEKQQCTPVKVEQAKVTPQQVVRPAAVTVPVLKPFVSSVEPLKQPQIGLFGSIGNKGAETLPFGSRPDISITKVVQDTTKSLPVSKSPLTTTPSSGLFGASATTAGFKFGATVPTEATKPPDSLQKPFFSMPATKPAAVESKAPVPEVTGSPISATSAPAAAKTPVTTTVSLFGSVPLISMTTGGALFSRTSPAITASSSGSVFGSSSKGLFSTGTGLFGAVNPTTTVTAAGTTTTTTSTATSAKTTVPASITSTAPSLFGNISAANKTSLISSTVAPTATTAPPLFSLVTANTTTTTATTTSKSLFGDVPIISTTSSIFGASGVAVPSTTKSEAVTTTSPAVTEADSTVATTASSKTFGTIVTSSTTSSGLFGSVSNTTATTTSSAFGSPVATSTSVFGVVTPTTSTNVFSNVVSQSSTVFGGTAAAPAAVTTTATSGIFGGATPTTSASVFGNSGLFGTATTAPPTTGGLFVSTSTPATISSPNVFSSAAATTSAGLFGSSPAVSTTSSGLFGAVATTPTTSSSVFGSPLFGASPSTTTTTTGSSFFGSFTQTPATTAASVFGATTLPTAVSGFGADINQTANLFGQMLNAPSTPTSPQTNVFAQTPQKSGFDSGTNIFGGGTPSSTSSLFGSTTNAFGQTTSPSIFGAATSSSANIFGQQTATTSSSSFFGQNICSPFGAATTAPNQSPFSSPVAANATTQSAFGSSPFSKPIFGQSVFGQSGSSSLFGANNTAQSSSIFGGNSSGGSFQTNTFSGPFSGGVAQSGFGAAPSFSKPAGSGFGSAPVFGGAPAASSFGGSPTFGSSLPFGASPTKVFGGGGTGPVFGQQQSPGFESLASQNTVGFGNLAQNPLAQSSFGSGFSSPQQNTFGSQPQQQQSPSFGGSSFSSWR